MSSLLIVDDELQLRELIKKYAVAYGYLADTAVDGIDAIEKCKKSHYDLIIMDIMMPNLDGFQAVKEIRKTSFVPVIMLSARQEEYDKIYGFDLGIDDYVTKPFSVKELMLRVKAILNRIEKMNEIKKAEENVFSYLTLKIDFSAYNVFVDEEEVILTRKEFDLLSFLVNNIGQVVEREKLIEEVWGYEFDKEDHNRTLDTHVKQIRKKIKQYADCIITVRGVGYRFEKK